MKSTKFKKINLLISKRLAINFDGLNMRQYLKVVPVVFSNRIVETKMMMALHALVISRWKFRMVYFFTIMDERQLFDLADQTEWIFSPDQKCEKNLIPRIWLRRRYYGPKKTLSNISWGEFRNAADYFTLFENKNDESFLVSAVALLYKCKGEDNNEKFEKRCKLFKKLPQNVLYGVYLNWILMLNYLSGIFPEVFRKSKKKSKTIQLWYHFMNEWMEFKTEDFERKDSLPAMEVLASLNELMKASRQKAKVKRQKNH